MEYTIYDFPDCLSVFRGMNRDELIQLPVRHYAPKEALILEGTSSKKELYFLLQGVCAGEEKRKTGYNENLYIKYPKGYFLGLLETSLPKRISA